MEDLGWENTLENLISLEDVEMEEDSWDEEDGLVFEEVIITDLVHLLGQEQEEDEEAGREDPLPKDNDVETYRNKNIC